MGQLDLPIAGARSKWTRSTIRLHGSTVIQRGARAATVPSSCRTRLATTCCSATTVRAAWRMFRHRTAGAVAMAVAVEPNAHRTSLSCATGRTLARGAWITAVKQQWRHARRWTGLENVSAQREVLCQLPGLKTAITSSGGMVRSTFGGTLRGRSVPQTARSISATSTPRSSLRLRRRLHRSRRGG